MPSSRSEQVWLSKLVIPALLGLGQGLSFPFSGPLSLSSFELQCYMLFPFLFFFLKVLTALALSDFIEENDKPSSSAHRMCQSLCKFLK